MNVLMRIFANRQKRTAAVVIRYVALLAFFIVLATQTNMRSLSLPLPIEDDPPSPAFTRGGYIPDQQCASCHRAIYRTYQQVGMAKSFYRPRSDNIIEDFKNNRFFHEPSNRHYEMIHDDGRFIMQRYQLDEEGQRTNEIRQQIDWVIGSGSHSRGYLYQTEVGELFELPVVWYTQEQSWGMAPGYDQPRHDGLTRPITRACMFCHNAYPNVPAGSDRYGQPQVFPASLPEGVGCQRCHGPGGEHVRLAEDLDAPDAAVIAAIVNPAKLPPRLRDDVCYQCHLQPTSKLTSFVRRFGRDDYSYRPGEALGDYLVHLDFDDGADRSQRFEINHHPYRLQQSKCYIASDGELNCLTCHDPHRKVPAAEAPAHYRDRCLSCHALDDCRLEKMTARPGEAAADNCVACHMPKRRTQDVVHVVMTDHLIQRRPDENVLAPLSETASPHGANIQLYWPDLALARSAVYQAIPAVINGDSSGLESLSAALATQSPAPLEALIELGTGQLQAKRYEDAQATFAEVAQREPDLALIWSNVGVALAGNGQDREAIESLTRAVELAPDRAQSHYNLAAAYVRLGNTDAAEQHYRQALQLRPNYVNAWINLGNLSARNGRFTDAVSAYRSALAIEPNTLAAYRNLGLALSYLDSWPEAIAAWRSGSRVAPNDAGISTQLAMAYLLAPDPTVRHALSGLRYAKQAVDADANSAKARLALAVAKLFNGQPADAIADAKAAHALHADETSCWLVVALAEHELNREVVAKKIFADVLGQLNEGRSPNRIREALLEHANTTFDQ